MKPNTRLFYTATCSKSGADHELAAVLQELLPIMTSAKGFRYQGILQSAANLDEIAILNAWNNFEYHPASVGTIHPRDFQKTMPLGPLGPIIPPSNEMFSPVGTEPTQ